jgi:hypothetical protein
MNQIERYEFEIEADDEEHAEQIADALYEEDRHKYHNDSDTEIDVVEN